MLGSLRGKIILKREKFVIVDVDKVGYKVNVSPDTLLKLEFFAKDNLISLWTHLHVREDGQELYGFLDYGDLELFEMLLNVSGIGPKSALLIMGVVSADILKKAIGENDISYLTKISGIGKKTAEKIVLELRDKIGEEKSDGSLRAEVDALEALKALGYSQNEAREALKKVVREANTNQKVKAALKILGNK